MTKIVRKLRPGSNWRIGEHEKWFQDMAAKGFHLKKVGFYFAYFVVGEPKEMKYRIDISLNKKVTSEQTDLYAENGWDYVTKQSYFQVYSSPTERNAPELHTDPAEQAFTFQALGKKLTLASTLMAISTTIMIALFSSIWWMDRTPIYDFAEGTAFVDLLLSIVIGHGTYEAFREARAIHALRKQLHAGIPINHNAPWKKFHQWHAVIMFTFTLLAGLSAVFPFTMLMKSETKTIPETDLNLPIVRLADIEQNPSLIREITYVNRGVDWGNRYTTNWSPIAPIQYESDESGMVPGEMWLDDSGEYSPSIHTRMYELSMPSLANSLIKDLMTRYKYDEQPIDDFKEMKHSFFDTLIVFEDEEEKKIFASKHDLIYYVQYYGYANVDTIIDEIVNTITTFTD